MRCLEVLVLSHSVFFRSFNAERWKAAQHICLARSIDNNIDDSIFKYYNQNMYESHFYSFRRKSLEGLYQDLERIYSLAVVFEKIRFVLSFVSSHSRFIIGRSRYQDIKNTK